MEDKSLEKVYNKFSKKIESSSRSCIIFGIIIITFIIIGYGSYIVVKQLDKIESYGKLKINVLKILEGDNPDKNKKPLLFYKIWDLLSGLILFCLFSIFPFLLYKKRIDYRNEKIKKKI